MAQRTRTVYPSKQNKGLSSTFQPLEEGQSLQKPKRCDKHGDKDEDNSPKNVNNIYKNIYIIYVLTIKEIVINLKKYVS